MYKKRKKNIKNTLKIQPFLPPMGASYVVKKYVVSVKRLVPSSIGK